MNNFEEFIQLELSKSANRSANSDEVPGDPWGFNAHDASGGNYDDAFYMGQEDGEIFFARSMLNKIEKWKANNE
jgi:hypothetical protein